MPTQIVKLNGTLKLGDVSTGKALETQVTNVGFPQTVTRDSFVQVLTGDIVQPPASYSWAVSGTMLLDLADKTGCFAYINTHQGEQSAFEFTPTGSGLTITGTCTVDGISMDDTDAGKMISGKFNFPISGEPLFTWTP